MSWSLNRSATYEEPVGEPSAKSGRKSRGVGTPYRLYDLDRAIVKDTTVKVTTEDRYPYDQRHSQGIKNKLSNTGIAK